MRDSLKEKCELLAENYTVIYQSFKFEFEMMNLVAASHFTNAGRKADPDVLCGSIQRFNTVIYGLRTICADLLSSYLHASVMNGFVFGSAQHGESI